MNEPMRDNPSDLSRRTAADLAEMRDEQRSVKELIIRIDERTKRMDKELEAMRREMVTRPEFSVVKAIAFGLVGLAMTLLMAAIMRNILK